MFQRNRNRAFIAMLALGFAVAGPGTHAQPRVTDTATGSSQNFLHGQARHASQPTALPKGWRIRAGAAGAELVYDTGAEILATGSGVWVDVAGERITAQVDGSKVVVRQADLPQDYSAMVVGGVHHLESDAAAEQPPRTRRAQQTPEPVPPVQLPADLRPTQPLETTSLTYHLPAMSDPEFATPVDVVARVIGPVNPTADMPIVLFAHGRYPTCATESGTKAGWPCPAGTFPTQAFEGFQYAQRALAEQGFLTVSIDLSAINANDSQTGDWGTAARSRLIRHHLTQLAAVSTVGNQPVLQSPSALAQQLPPVWRTRLDANSVILVGHSRGGEGIVRASVDTNDDDPYRVTGLIPWSPTNFDRRTAPTVPTAVILAGCDGDVYTHAGSGYVDRALDAGPIAAFATSIHIPGANHNFFNTQLTPGIARWPGMDDGKRTKCEASQRLSSATQRDLGAAYLVSAARSFTRADLTAQAYLDGSTRLTTPAGSALRVTPVGAAARQVWRGNLPGTPQAQLTAAELCTATNVNTYCSDRDAGERTPHWPVRDQRAIPAAKLHLTAVDQAQAKQAATLRFARPVDLTTGPQLETRIVVPPGQRFSHKLTLVDRDGRTMSPVIELGADLCGVNCSAPTSEDAHQRWLSQTVRYSLRGVRSINLHEVIEIRWDATESGQNAASDVILLDAHVVDRSQPATVTSVSALPRLAGPINLAPVVEGDTEHTHTLHYTFTKPVMAGSSLVVVTPRQRWDDPDVATFISIPPGAMTVNVPVTIPGNTIDDNARQRIMGKIETRGPLLFVEPTYSVHVLDDDIDAKFAVQQTYSEVSEGDALAWQIVADRPTQRSMTGRATAIAPGDTPPGRTNEMLPELSGADLEDAARYEWFLDGDAANTEAPLSATPAEAEFYVVGGSGRIDMGTTIDTASEPTEHVKLRLELTESTPGAAVEGRFVLTGAVHNGPPGEPEEFNLRTNAARYRLRSPRSSASLVMPQGKSNSDRRCQATHVTMMPCAHAHAHGRAHAHDAGAGSGANAHFLHSHHTATIDSSQRWRLASAGD